MKLVIVGGVAAGATAAARARRLDELAEIIVFEKSGYTSFANCGMPYHLGDTIPDEAKLMVSSPEKLKAEFNLDVRVNSEVLKINSEKKTVTVKNLKTNETYEESYDKLVLATGAKPFKPPMPGIDLPTLFALRNIEDMQSIKKTIKALKANVPAERKPSCAIIGAGFIGVEVAEQLQQVGIDVSVIELVDQVLPPFDKEMTNPVLKTMKSHGINVLLGEKVTQFSTASDKGMTNVHIASRTEPLAVDFVILSIGVRPDNQLALDAGLKVHERGGAILVNKHQQTSNPDIYAAGDNCCVRDFMSENENDTTFIPLAGPANRQGRIAASHIFGETPDSYRGSQGSSIIKCYDVVAACVGYSEKLCKIKNLQDVSSVYINGNDHVDYYPGACRISAKLVFNNKSGKILGAQFVGNNGVDSRVNSISMAIQGKMTVFDLEEAEMSYCPAFGAAKDVINMMGFVAANQIRGKVNFIPFLKAKEIMEKGEEIELRTSYKEFDPNSKKKQVILLDTRASVALKFTEKPFVHLPLPRFRKEVEAIVGDQSLYAKGTNNEIWTTCQIGRTAFFAYCQLSGKGYENIKAVQGGYESLQKLFL